MTDEETKREAVRCITEDGRSQAAVARELGVTRAAVHLWVCRLAPETVSPQKTYGEAFKRTAVSAVLEEDRTLAEVASEFGVDPGTVMAWKRKLAPEAVAPQKRYSEAFKREAVKVFLGDDREFAEFAKELGISPSTLHKWQNELAPEASRPKRGHSDKFKRDAVERLIAPGGTYRSVATILGVSEASLYAWKRELSSSAGSNSS